MRTFSKILLPTLLAATVAAVPLAVGYAQQAPATPPAAGAAPGPGPRQGFRPPSPDTMQRMLDGRLAAAKAALRLSEAQLKLWAPVEDLAKQGHARREQRMREMQGRGGPPVPGAELALPDRLDRMSQMMAERATQTKAMSEALKPLYATLSDEQKAVLGPALRQLAGFGPGSGGKGRGGMGGHGGPRFAGPDGRGGPPPR